MRVKPDSLGGAREAAGLTAVCRRSSRQLTLPLRRAGQIKLQSILVHPPPCGLMLCPFDSGAGNGGVAWDGRLSPDWKGVVSVTGWHVLAREPRAAARWQSGGSVAVTSWPCSRYKSIPPCQPPPDFGKLANSSRHTHREGGVTKFSGGSWRSGSVSCRVQTLPPAAKPAPSPGLANQTPENPVTPYNDENCSVVPPFL